MVGYPDTGPSCSIVCLTLTALCRYTSEVHLHLTPSILTMSTTDEMREWRDQVSGVIGQHLLQGFCMLATYCDVCPPGVPLMRDRSKNVMCVACKDVSSIFYAHTATALLTTAALVSITSTGWFLSTTLGLP
jgi:hypothetical protein